MSKATRPPKKEAKKPKFRSSKRVNRAVFALFLWFLIVLSLTIIIFVDPRLDKAETYTIVVVYACACTYATWLTFGETLHQIIGQVAVFVGLMFGRLVARIYKNARSRQKVQVKTIPSPARVATRSLDVASVHPSVLRSPGCAVVGYDKRRRPIIVDFGDNRHTLVGASTGGGKTTLLRSLLIQWLNKPVPPEIYLIDCKGSLDDGLRRFSPLVHYVFGAESALEKLRALYKMMQERDASGSYSRPILVIVDELADLTNNESPSTKRSAISLLTQLSRLMRSAHMNGVWMTQTPHFTVVPTTIRNNLTRKILMVPDSPDHAKSVLNQRPPPSITPKRPGDFILKELSFKSGRTIYTSNEDALHEIDELIAGKLADLDDVRLQLWREISVGKQIGDRVVGVNALKDSFEDMNQTEIMYAYRNFALAGVIEMNGGKAYRIANDFVDGVGVLRQYIDGGNWKEEPKPIRSGDD